MRTEQKVVQCYSVWQGKADFIQRSAQSQECKRRNSRKIEEGVHTEGKGHTSKQKQLCEKEQTDTVSRNLLYWRGGGNVRGQNIWSQVVADGSQAAKSMAINRADLEY